MKIWPNAAILVLVACARETQAIHEPSATALQTSKSMLPTSTPSPKINWFLVTPLNETYTSSDGLISIIKQLLPELCTSQNLLLLTPMPAELANQAPLLKFTELGELPAPIPQYFLQRADNPNKSRTVYYLGHQPGEPGKIYFTENTAGKIYEIYSGRTFDELLQWINNDTFIAAQQGQAWINVVAINVEKQQFEYFGMAYNCSATPTP